MSRSVVNKEKTGKCTTYIRKNLKALLMIIIMISTAAGGITKAEASSFTQVSVNIDYLEETAVISPGSGNSTKFYLSTDNQKTWEAIDPIGTFDISALLQKKETTVYFKGNKDLSPAPVKLQAEDGSLKAAYQVVSGVGFIVLTNASYPVEYKKGPNGQWKTASISTPAVMYEMKGATLYFRTAATADRRAGATVTVRIPKKPSAPSVKMDGSKLYITGLKNGETQYRVNDATEWSTFTPTDPTVKTLDIAGLFGAGTVPNTQIPAGVVEFRTKATDRKVASTVKTIEVPVQPGTPNNIILNGTTLTIQDTDLKKAYEYTRVENGAALDIKTAKWTTVTAARPVIIPKASIGDLIYVRLKSATDPVTKQIIPASTYKELSVSSITLKP